jgi:ankyrin repeat protein
MDIDRADTNVKCIFSALAILDLPTEVLANQIFKFFCFNTCITWLPYVCKLFDQAMQVANFRKQIRLDISNSSHLQYAPRVLSKYQVDTLILKSPGSSLSILSSILRSSSRLRTLVICEIENNKIGFIDLDGNESIIKQLTKAKFQSNPFFEHITTLSIPARSTSIVQLFPRITRLKLVGTYTHDTDLCLPSVKELEIETCNAEDLLLIKEVFPALQTAYVLPMIKSKNTQSSDDSNDEDDEDDDEEEDEKETFEQICDKLEEISKSIDVEVKCRFNHLLRDNRFDLSAISYHEYFNAFGETPLGTFIEFHSVEKPLEMASLTTGEYERSFWNRDPLFKFPQLSPQFSFSTVSVAYYGHSNPKAHQPLVDMGLASFWRLLVRDTQQAIKRFHELPIEPRIIVGDPGRLLFKLFKKIPFDEILAKIGQENLRRLLRNVNAQQEYSFIHIYALSEKVLDLTPIADLIDWNLLDKDECNAATVAFLEGNYPKWLELLQYGCSLQEEKNAHLVRFILSDFYSANSTKIYEAIGGKRILMMIPDDEMDEGCIEAIDKLVEYGEDINQSCAGGSSYFNCIAAIEPSSNGNVILKHLLNKYKIDVNHVPASGRTALTTAINFNQLEKIEVLLLHGADPHFGGKDLSPLFQVLKKIQSDDVIPCIRTLLSYGADINRLDYDEYGRKISPLAMAVLCERATSQLTFMVECGARLDFVDENGNNLIHYALLADEIDHVVECVQYFSKHCDINWRNNFGRSPLHVALCDNFVSEICVAIIDCGADVNLPARDGRTLLSLAVSGNTYVIEHLLKKENIDIRARDFKGRTCFHYLAEVAAQPILSMMQDEQFKQRLKAYATPENIDFMKAELKSCFNDPEYADLLLNLERFFTYNVSLTKYLIETIGIDPNWVDQDGDNLLGGISFVSGRSEEVMEYLISKGTNINHQNKIGNTVLHIVFENNSLEYNDMKERQWLLKCGADPTIKNNKGISPADLEPNWKSFLGNELKMAGLANLKRVDLMELRKKGLIVPQPKRQKTSK